MSESVCGDAVAAIDRNLSGNVRCVYVCICLRQKVQSERTFITYASSADTWRIEPSDQKAVTISGSFPLRENPRYGTNEEDKGNDRLTSGPSAPLYDFNEEKKRDET